MKNKAQHENNDGFERIIFEKREKCTQWRGWEEFTGSLRRNLVVKSKETTILLVLHIESSSK
jgi:hypothetical protein